MHQTEPHCTPLYLTSPHSTSQHYTVPHFTKLYLTALHSTSLHYTVPHFTKLYLTALHSTSLHYTLPHFNKLYLTALHCTSLHYTVPHCTTLYLTSKVRDEYDETFTSVLGLRFEISRQHFIHGAIKLKYEFLILVYVYSHTPTFCSIGPFGYHHVYGCDHTR